MSVMLYKYPAEKKTPQNKMHGDHFDYIIVEDDDVEKSVKDGWALTTEEAKNPPKKTAQRRRKKKDELD